MSDLPATLSPSAVPVRLDEIKAAIAKAETVEEAVDLVQTATTIVGSPQIRESIARASGVDALKLERVYREAALWAGRRLGALLRGALPRQGQRPTDEHVLLVTQLGLTKPKIRCYKALADIPEDRVAAYVAEADEPTRTGLFKWSGLSASGGRQAQAAEPKKPKADFVVEEFDPLPPGFSGLLTDFDPEPEPDDERPAPDDPQAFARELVALCSAAMQAVYKARALADTAGGSWYLETCRKQLQLAGHMVAEAGGAADDYAAEVGA